MQTRHRASLMPTQDPEEGATLVELLVVLVIVSMLAVMAVPLAETSMQRRQEIALQEALRTVRSSIDAFHQDWRDERFAETSEDVSENGYPVRLGVLINGMEITLSDGKKKKRRYLRRIPRNPFYKGPNAAAGWVFIGYEQRAGTTTWNSVDVFDLTAKTDKEALDGTPINTW